ncbi:MAG: hypothetical protein ACRETM_03440 [Stenotrophobium sp.]
MTPSEFRPARIFRCGLPPLAAALLLSACAAVPPKYLPLMLDTAPEVVVHPFSTKAAGDAYRGDTDYGQAFAEYLAGALQSDGIRAQVMPDDTASRGERFIVEGDISQIYLGSAPLHAWSWFGNDQASFSAGYRMTDTHDGAAHYAGQAQDDVNGADDRELALQKSASEAAYDLADMIEHDLHAAAKKDKKHKK